MSRSVQAVGGATLLLVACASVAWAMHARHLAWDGMVLGKGASKIRGLITMEGGAIAGTTRANISYKGDVGGATRVWQVRAGSCARGGGVLGDVRAYAPLRTSATGVAEGGATLKSALPDSGEYFVGVYASSKRSAAMIACGDLLLEE